MMCRSLAKSKRSFIKQSFSPASGAYWLFAERIALGNHAMNVWCHPQQARNIQGFPTPPQNANMSVVISTPPEAFF